MSATDWDEIKRLANDFQRIQLSSAAQKLSERNCIEIVQKLIDLKLLDVFYTLNGKEYLTPVELLKEIQEELTLAGGRVNLADLQQNLNVDFSHIEAAASDLLKQDSSIRLVLGQLIDRHYFAHLAEEINDRLQEQGSVSLSELAKIHNLPGDVLKELIQKNLGKSILGRCSEDGNDLYTEDFMGRHKAVIKATFAAVSRPTQVFPLVSKCHCPERLFYSLLDELVAENELPGSLAGARPYNVTYTPHLYSKCQLDWVDAFFKQNSYLEYDNLTRLGFGDPESFIKKRYKDVHMLSSCCLGALFKERVVAEMDEFVSAGNIYDVSNLLPSICSDDDLRMFLNSIIKNRKDLMVMAGHHLVGSKVVSDAVASFRQLIESKAEETVKNNPSILVSLEKIESEAPTRKEEAKESKKKKGSKGSGGGHGGMGGGGASGREVKTKNTKKKYMQKDDDGGHDDADQENEDKKQFTFMDTEEISNHLSALSLFHQSPRELLQAMASHIHKILNNQYNDEMKKVFMNSIQKVRNNEEDSSDQQYKRPPTTVNKKKLLTELLEKLNNHWTNFKLYQKALTFFKDEAHVQLSIHLLKTHCKELFDILLSIINTNTYTDLTDEEQKKAVSLIVDEATKSCANRLQASLKSKSVEDFNDLYEKICEQSNISLKRDKKKERLLQFNHRHSLMDSLNSSKDPALSLHLVSVILFNSFTQSVLHSSGRSVPSIISFLQLHLLPEHHTLMTQCQDAVIKALKSKSGEEKAKVEEELEILMGKIKDLPEIVKNYPKKED